MWLPQVAIMKFIYKLSFQFLLFYVLVSPVSICKSQSNGRAALKVSHSKKSLTVKIVKLAQRSGNFTDY